jgi:hypothetical protein
MGNFYKNIFDSVLQFLAKPTCLGHFGQCDTNRDDPICDMFPSMFVER